MARIEDMYYPPREPGFALKQEIKALQAQLDALRPVPVDQVESLHPEWMDGRDIIGYFDDRPWARVWWEAVPQEWRTWPGGRGICSCSPTHVSLPLPPQEPDNA